MATAGHSLGKTTKNIWQAPKNTRSGECFVL